jgi:hypothetical protein
MTLTALTVLLPVFFVLGLGYFAGHAKKFDANQVAGLNELAYWLELLVDGKIVPPEKLSALRQECYELIAIFVTILKRSKETS